MRMLLPLLALVLALGLGVVSADEHPVPPTLDYDGDTFSDTLELHIGTDWQWACTDDAAIDVFPPDFTHDTYTDIADMVLLAGHFGKVVPDAPVRFDIAPEPDGDNVVDIGDIVRLAGMFGQTCTDLTVPASPGSSEMVTFTSSSDDSPPEGVAAATGPGSWHTCYNRVSAFSGQTKLNHRITFESAGTGFGMIYLESAAWAETSGMWFKTRTITHSSAFLAPDPLPGPYTRGWAVSQQLWSHPGTGGVEWVALIWTEFFDNRTCRHAYKTYWWN